MHRTLHVGAVLVVVSLIAACQQAPRSVVGPSAIGGAALNDSSDDVRWGSALQDGITHSAANYSGFQCLLGGVPAHTSHATISNSGNQTLVCSGQTTANPDRAEHTEGFPCLLHFGGTTYDSRRVVSPSGHATLVCKG